jgi:hypothetical protein
MKNRSKVGMTNKETSKRILKWCQKSQDSWDLIFSWPTDGCGYNQHLRFVEYRNLNWHGGTEKEFRDFVAGYAEKLCLTEDNAGIVEDEVFGF